MPLPSGFEWIVILVIALLILGPGKLPDVASAVGKSIREFRKASSDVQEAVKVDTSPLPNTTTTPPTPNVLAQAAGRPATVGVRDSRRRQPPQTRPRRAKPRPSLARLSAVPLT